MLTDQPLALRPFADFNVFDAHRHSPESVFTLTLARDRDFLRRPEAYELEFYCAVCDMPTAMRISKALGFDEDDMRIPLWRETIDCPRCGLNNRKRALLHLMASQKRFPGQAHIYMTEQVTGTFRAARLSWPDIVGSEFLRDGTPFGGINALGVRCEDMTRLSFQDDAFDGVVTMDVIEHVPDYRRALAECHRVLKPGGVLLLSAPFNLDIVQSQVRALVQPSGEIKHLLPPEYHADPLDPHGLLCFTTFGWDFLESLRRIGFEQPSLNFYWSDHFGYLGVQYCVLASKARRSPSAPLFARARHLFPGWRKAET